VRLHDDVEAVEEKRARYEEELDRVNDMLAESESRRQALQKEVDLLVEQVGPTSFLFRNFRHRLVAVINVLYRPADIGEL